MLCMLRVSFQVMNLTLENLTIILLEGIINISTVSNFATYPFVKLKFLSTHSPRFSYKAAISSAAFFAEAINTWRYRFGFSSECGNTQR